MTTNNKTKELEYDEFLKYLKNNGITFAKTTEKFNDIPKGKKLYFNLNSIYISTYDEDTQNKNKQFNYSFDYQWYEIWRDYKGKFIIQSQETKESASRTDEKEQSSESSPDTKILKTKNNEFWEIEYKDFGSLDMECSFCKKNAYEKNYQVSRNKNIELTICEDCLKKIKNN